MAQGKGSECLSDQRNKARKIGKGILRKEKKKKKKKNYRLDEKIV